MAAIIAACFVTTASYADLFYKRHIAFSYLVINIISISPS